MKIYIQNVHPAYIEVTVNDSSTKEFEIDFYVVEYDMHLSRKNVLAGKTVVGPEHSNIADMAEVIRKSIQKQLDAKD